MREFKYEVYGGPEDFIFIRCHKKDKQQALDLANGLVDEKIRVFFDCIAEKKKKLPEEIAGGILNAKLCVFYISDAALNDLDFRNSINFALNRKIETVCVRKQEKEMGHGMDVQLANVRFFKNNDELYAYIRSQDKFKDCQGEGQILSADDGTKRKPVLVTGLFLLALLVLVAFMIRNRITYYRSAQYRLSRIEETEYLDFTAFNEADLIYLEDKQIAFLNCAMMDLKSSDLLRNIEIETIDISGNKDLDVSGLCANKILKTVILTQDMLKAADQLYTAGKEVRLSK